MPITTCSIQERIAALNDTFRRSLISGKVIFTIGISALPDEDKQAILTKVRNFYAFTPDNDPYGEHDFGSFEHDGKKIFFKIDYYDSTLTYGSENPSDPSQTTRVLTVMLGQEY